MKPNQIPIDDRALDGALRAWTVVDPLPPGFQEQVWRRVERAESEPAYGIWQSALRFVGTFLLRPKVAVSYLALLLLLGIAMGSWAAQVRSNRVAAQLGSRYVHLINPYLVEAPAR